VVSLIIPNYNYAEYLKECLESCIHQGFLSEIIVVDDASTDDSVEVLGKFPQVSVVENSKNRGVAYCRNRGLEKATGDYIVFLDADDMLLPKSIAMRAICLNENPGIDMVYGQAKKINVDRKNYQWSYKKCLSKLKSLESYSRRMNAQTLMWRRRVFEKHGGYYEPLRSKEDKELLFRFGIHRDSPLKQKIKVKKINRFVAVYRRHPKAKHKRRIANKKWAKETEKTFEHRIKKLKKEGVTRRNTWFPQKTLEK
jgi:glycosyltransferase involved in cell wall biosynthesis